MVQESTKTNTEITNWYTVKVRNNYEQIVADRIKLEMQRIKRDFKIVIPKEKIVFAKKGKKASKEKMLYPGYIFVETLYISELIGIVRETTGATNVLSSKETREPIRLRRSEVKSMLLAEEELQKPISDEFYTKGEYVKILTGPFEGFEAAIEDMDSEKNKVKVLVNIFKKQTPVELTFDDITKI